MMNRYLNRDTHKDYKSAIASIVETADDLSRIENELHNFYKYPACFPPKLAAQIIGAFSSPGDLIIDPFVGGGTSAVECLLMGRRFIGVDINDLAILSSKVKTTPLSTNALLALDAWIAKLSSIEPPTDFDLDEFPVEPDLSPLPEDVYYLMGKIRANINKLKDPQVRRFAQCVTLRVGKTRIEGNYDRLRFEEILKGIVEIYETMVETVIELKSHLKTIPEFFKPKLIKGDSTDPRVVESIRKIKGRRKVKLIITSPPYPGISVLYNRWQISGRRETMLPYWLIGSKQRESASYYTMGHPKTAQGIEDYFRKIKLSFSHMKDIAEKDTLIVQIVAFGDRRTQFNAYLDAMSEAGLVEIRKVNSNSFDGRVWRTVANRKWYNHYKENARNRSEAILFFRKK